MGHICQNCDGHVNKESAGGFAAGPAQQWRHQL